MRGQVTGEKLEHLADASGAVSDPDAPLLVRARAGDRTALCQLYKRHVDGVFRRLTHLLGPDPDREDLTQQIFAEVLGNLRTFRGEARFQSFLYRVTSHRACDQLRRRRRQPLRWTVEVEEVSSPSLSPEQSAIRAEEVASVWQYLDRIRPKKRVAWLLRLVEGLSLEEIAEQTGARPSAVAKRIAHAQRELLEHLRRDRRTGP